MKKLPFSCLLATTFAFIGCTSLASVPTKPDLPQSVVSMSSTSSSNSSSTKAKKVKKSKSSKKTAASEKIDTKGANLFPTHRAATGKRVFIFDPKLTAWAAYDASGDRVNTGRASGGRMFCPDVGRSCRTVVGTFSVLYKGGPGCASKVYPLETNGGAPMPYCMKFHKKGYAIHGSHDVPNHNASHGCIRVTPAAAKWLSNNFIQNGTTVVVREY